MMGLVNQTFAGWETILEKIHVHLNIEYVEVQYFGEQYATWNIN